MMVKKLLADTQHGEDREAAQKTLSDLRGQIHENYNIRKNPWAI